jgi:hypothetical protein
VELKYGTRLVGARDESNYPIDVYDDGDGAVWLWGDETGVRRVIRARSFEAAWGIAIDESPTIDETDVPEAYGFDGAHAALRPRQAGERADAGDGEYPELVEGYEHQDNASGTGIVNVGHYAWLREWTRDDTARLRLIVRSHDCPVLDVTFAVRSDHIAYQIEGEGLALHTYHPISAIGTALRVLDGRYHAVNAGVRWER